MLFHLANVPFIASDFLLDSCLAYCAIEAIDKLVCINTILKRFSDSWTFLFVQKGDKKLVKLQYNVNQFPYAQKPFQAPKPDLYPQFTIFFHQRYSLMASLGNERTVTRVTKLLKFSDLDTKGVSTIIWIKANTLSFVIRVLIIY